MLPKCNRQPGYPITLDGGTYRMNTASGKDAYVAGGKPFHLHQRQDVGL